MEGKKIAYIEQELLHLTPHYNVYINDILEFQIIKKFQLFKNDYLLSNGYRVEGNFMMLDFTIYDDNNNQIGSIKRKFLSIGEKYEIEINDKFFIYILNEKKERDKVQLSSFLKEERERGGEYLRTIFRFNLSIMSL